MFTLFNTNINNIVYMNIDINPLWMVIVFRLNFLLSKRILIFYYIITQLFIYRNPSSYF